MNYGRTVLYALIGAVVAVVLSFIPFSTVIGGAVAGFLEGPDEKQGAITGALTGLISFLPIVGFAFLVIAFLGFGVGLTGAPAGGFAVGLFVIGFVASLVFIYTVGLAALGGFLGAIVAREYPEHRTRTRETIGVSGDARGEPSDYDRRETPGYGSFEGDDRDLESNGSRDRSTDRLER